MKNLLLMAAILGLVACGNTETTEVTETVDTLAVDTNTLDTSELETTQELLDTLETLPSATPE